MMVLAGVCSCVPTKYDAVLMGGCKQQNWGCEFLDSDWL